MSGATRIGALVALVIVLILVSNAAFTVQQTQHALVLRFGDVRRTLSDPGLYFKIPLVESVISVDKRILDLDVAPQTVLEAGQKQLVVDSFARYRIRDPLRFYQAVGSRAGATQQLQAVVSAAVRGVIAESKMEDIVKNQRGQLQGRMLNQVNQQVMSRGIDVVDLRLRQVVLPAKNTEAVFGRMVSARQREAQEIRAEGTQLSTGIRADADRTVQSITGEANRQSEEIRGAADAEKNKIFADAFGRDPAFFGFYRSMQAYETGFKPESTRMVLSPGSSFFRYFNDPAGLATNVQPPSPGAAPAPPAK
ncbi:protease FtsH subunit HflC [Rhizobiales bacterium GAS191]|nr:protease FtsH subunit HflC [Rhizobiales bacterium GAS113]SED91297.1 protease FtsH subunit HflC [Rhizobiales bacterium GAS191]SEE55608.1 protease FtsH subunit HflC [Rhizobiales bacterium GAS188]